MFKELIDLILHKGNMKRDDHWIDGRAPYLDYAICSQEYFSLAFKTQRSSLNERRVTVNKQPGKSSKKLFDKYAHNLQWDNVTLGKISGELQSKINSEFPEARYHYKTHMIATHLPDHFLPRRVFRLTRSDRLTTCQPDWIILKTIQVLKMNRRPYLSFEIHLMSLFLSINGWHYSRITKIILGIQASFHWNLVFQYELYLMVHIIWTISYKTFFKIWSRVGHRISII